MLENEEKLAEMIIEISGVEPKKCMKCGKCSGTCPNYSEMDIPPHRFVSMIDRGRIAELLESETIWMCLSCLACVERCPRNVEPAKLIEAVRLAVIRRQGGNHLLAKDIPQKLDDDTPGQLLVSAFRKYSK